MVTYQVRLLGDDGKEYLITYEALRRKLEIPERWNPVTETLSKDVEELKDFMVDEILLCKAKESIISFLKERPKVETRILNRQGYKLDGLKWRAWYRAKEELEKDGIIVSVKQGRGKNRVWLLKEA